ncbi:hypothetical protein [Mucilaginibacter celer]|uniref:Uncharacterized protein n=1 Tax=Mucilaginibacter celer TaxID=2305508 RepID=A0A494W2A3_9SPHI|nr:hypothetical protein [Mucilaginibacter celer]AYL97893.1 hypothetical protein HYN43_022495 [Mucilaginibacter celer]
MLKKVQLAHIRYNTNSDGQNQCWRLVLDGEEILVESVQIEAPVFTSKDWIEPIGQFKHHISVRDCSVMINETGDALIAPLLVVQG